MKHSIGSYLIIVHLNRFVNLTQRHVNFAEKNVFLIVTVTIEHLN